MNSICCKCKKEFRIDFLVDDALWAILGPKSDGAMSNTKMCGRCIVSALEEIGEYGAFRLNDVCGTFTGKAPQELQKQTGQQEYSKKEMSQYSNMMQGPPGRRKENEKATKHAV